ncbi:hypothetical protein HPO96_36505 [Kribbella sandramycini]|uniref:Uncharacterized protein n=1 Tax=Kribbella sandramycini TaxID=60450 RepID=A0A7Y4L9C6_9ACTN|nr:hypothetical protein [Kribbella sandramycini]MBB6567223.1 hypothetical protein [Kribbella sandramycini]NOL45761.1 hypothetical protein [Kribbella sandramycini]
MHETDLHLEPNEASDLCRLFGPDELARRGWERAFVTVLDEATAENAIAVLAHAAGAAMDEGWTAVRVPADAGVHNGKTEDAEACAARGGYVYLVGSQFGKKRGPLAAKRSWIARVRESAIARALDDGTSAELDVVRLRFTLHRAINDALAGTDLLPLGPLGRQVYVDATIAAGEQKAKSWSGTVLPTDHPINIEAAEFTAEGTLLLGIRYPVTATGHPILVELANVDDLFTDPNAVPRCTRVWTLTDIGTPAAPAGFRALDTRDGVHFDAIIGDLDAAGKSATVLADHPEGALADSEHIAFTLTPTPAPLDTKSIHHFGDIRRVEGLAVDAQGHTHYVLDEEGHVALRTLVYE